MDCKNCKFYSLRQSIGGQLTPVCRKNAPGVAVSLTPVDASRTHIVEHTAWPRIQDGDWCDEFAPQLQ